VDAYLKRTRAIRCRRLGSTGLQPDRGCGDSRRSREAVRRVHRRAGFRGQCQGNFRSQEKTCACWNCPRRTGSGAGTSAQAHSGGMLVQQPDFGELARRSCARSRSARPRPKRCTPCGLPGSGEAREVQPIVFAKDGATLGIGAGQMSRVDSVKIGDEAQSPLQGSVVGRTRSFRFPTASKRPPRPAPRP